MIHIIGKKYNLWPGIYKEIDEYQCRHCDVFKDTKCRYANRAGVLQAYGVKRPWELVSIDIEESTNADGSKFSWLYIICFFSKFTEGIVMNGKTTGNVISALTSSTAWKAGIPNQLTGNNDTAFVNSELFR